MPRLPKQRGSVFQYQTFEKPYKYQSYDYRSCQFTDHPLIPPEQILFSRTRYADYGEKSGTEGNDDAHDNDTTPPTPEPEMEPVEVIDLDEPVLDDGQSHDSTFNEFTNTCAEAVDPAPEPEEEPVANDPGELQADPEGMNFRSSPMVIILTMPSSHGRPAGR